MCIHVANGFDRLGSDRSPHFKRCAPTKLRASPIYLRGLYKRGFTATHPHASRAALLPVLHARLSTRPRASAFNQPLKQWSSGKNITTQLPDTGRDVATTARDMLPPHNSAQRPCVSSQISMESFMSAVRSPPSTVLYLPGALVSQRDDHFQSPSGF